MSRKYGRRDGMLRLLLPLALMGSIAALESQAEPLASSALFGGETVLTLPATLDLDLGREGTIELWLQVGWTGELLHAPCILSAFDSAGTALAVNLTPNANGLVITDGHAVEGLPFPFGDGAFHHLALVIRSTTCNVLIDGSDLGALPLRIPSLAGRTLVLGGDAVGLGFAGAIDGLRFWRRALTPETLTRLMELPPSATPPPSWPEAADLAAMALFDEQGGQLITFPASRAPASAPSVPAPFDGETHLDYKLTEPILPGDTGTIDVWLVVAGQRLEESCVCAQDGRFALRLRSGMDAIAVETGGRFLELEGTLVDGQEPHHVAVTFESDMSRVWLDGSVVGQLPLGKPGTKAGALRIGSCDGSAGHFVGSLADLRFWSGVAEAQDVSDMASTSGLPAKGAPLAELGLSAWVDFTGEGFALRMATKGVETGARRTIAPTTVTVPSTVAPKPRKGASP